MQIQDVYKVNIRCYITRHYRDICCKTVKKDVFNHSACDNLIPKMHL